MPAADVVLLIVAGIGAGLCGTVAGVASLVSYPALLAVGLPAVSANVTNTVALTVTGLGAAAASRDELAGQAPRLRRLAPVIGAGGVTGAALLLLTPAGTFERIVPFLVGGASALLLVQPRIRTASLSAVERSPGRAGSAALAAGLFLVAVYGGYFGAAAGVLMLALITIGLPVSLLQGNALKNVLLGVANAVAAAGFAFLGPVQWAAALSLAVGVGIGAFAGPAVARRVPTTALRIGIGVAGLALAAALAVGAY